MPELKTATGTLFYEVSESPQERRGCAEIFGYGAHDCFALEKREIVDSDFDDRRCASRALGCVTAASAVRPNVVEDDFDARYVMSLRAKSRC